MHSFLIANGKARSFFVIYCKYESKTKNHQTTFCILAIYLSNYIKIKSSDFVCLIQYKKIDDLFKRNVFFNDTQKVISKWICITLNVEIRYCFLCPKKMGAAEHIQWNMRKWFRDLLQFEISLVKPDDNMHQIKKWIYIANVSKSMKP